MKTSLGLLGLAFLAMGCAQSEDNLYGDPMDASTEFEIAPEGDAAKDSSDSEDAGADANETASDADGVSCTCDQPGCGSCPTVAVVAAGGYGIDATEVTNADYDAWLATHPDASLQTGDCAWNKSYVPSASWPATSGKSLNPVVFVDHCDAAAYCKWARKRLCGAISGGSAAFADFANPSSSQWFHACSAGGSRIYPYGASYSQSACNGADMAAGASVEVGSSTGCEGGYPSLRDMSGNVWEWEDSCTGLGGENDLCRIRGGSYAQASAALTCAAESSLARNSTGQSVGFRCCE